MFGDIDNTNNSIKYLIIQEAFTMEMMAMELMDYSLNWSMFPFYSVVYSRQDNFASKKSNCRQFFGITVYYVKNIFSISNCRYN